MLFIQCLVQLNNFNRDYMPVNNYATDTALAASNGASMMGYNQGGTGAATILQQTKNKQVVSVADMAGADPTGVTSSTAAFTSAGSLAATIEVNITAGIWNLATSPTPTGNVTWIIHNGATFTGAGVLPNSNQIKFGPSPLTWVDTVLSGAYEYLEANSSFNPRAKADNISSFSAVRSSTGTGLAGSANIGWASFAYNDHATSGYVWGNYSTLLRASGVGGSTIGHEIDVANLGATVYLYPSSPFTSGLTAGMFLAAGGESTNVQNVGISSVALNIVSNDAGLHLPIAQWDKGIIFHNEAISGANGATGTGTAIALATGHTISWFNNSNNQVCNIYAVAGLTSAQGQSMIFESDGIHFTNSTDGTTQFQIENTPYSANNIAIISNVTTGAPTLAAVGSDTNINIKVQPKGTGVFQVTYGSTVATTPSNFVASRRLAFMDGNGVLWYIPISTTTW